MADEPSYQRKVTPNPDRPKLAAKRERELAPVFEASAKAYDELEAAREEANAVTQQVADLVERLRGGAVTAELEATDSLVHAITEQDRKP